MTDWLDRLTVIAGKSGKEMWGKRDERAIHIHGFLIKFSSG